MRRAQRLQFGPYRQPRYRLGQKVDCERRGELTIVGTSAGRIPWPIGKSLRAKSLILYGDLIRAVKQEAPVAVRYWWGVACETVRHWRKVLKVPYANPGTRQNRRDVFLGKKGAKARAAGALTLSDPVRIEKIRAKAIGRKHTTETKAKLRAAMLGVKLSKTTRLKMSEAHLHRGTRPPKAGPAWSAKEEALLWKLPAPKVAARTGRSLSAVYGRRSTLGLNNGRTTRHQRASGN